MKLVIEGNREEIKNVLNTIKGSDEYVNVNISLNGKKVAKGQFACLDL